jgi:putative two-component system response regulator
MAAPLHDVGKIGIPDEILLKPGPLSREEHGRMQEHSEVGYRLLAGSGSELLETAATIAWTHHERWDGSGYPRGLAAEDIPVEGRIVAVLDVFDALTHDRVYRPAMDLPKALEIIREGRGAHFDPQVLDVFFSALDELIAIGRDGAWHAAPAAKPLG